jgi:GNAT superfamily N-acetyltransferase
MEVNMSLPVSVRLDDDVRATLEAEARARKLGLSSYLRELARERARELRRDRIRQQSRAVAAHVEREPDAAGFYEAWGSVAGPPERKT